MVGFPAQHGLAMKWRLPGLAENPANLPFYSNVRSKIHVVLTKLITQLTNTLFYIYQTIITKFSRKFS